MCVWYLVGDIVHHNYAVRASVIGAGDSAKPLLASCVPLGKMQRSQTEISELAGKLLAEMADTQFEV